VLKLRYGFYRELTDYVTESKPLEVCGLLGGVRERKTKTVKKIYFIKNVLESNCEYLMDTAEQLAAAKDMRSNGLDMVGCFHSHPEGPPHPSASDVKTSVFDNISYVIISMENDVPVLKSYKIVNGLYMEEGIILV